MLLAPLDWGLGHATRCIPIINELITNEYEVFLGADDQTAALLQKEFPTIKIIPLEGYKVTYGRNRKLFFIKILSQFFKINSAIKRENIWLSETIKKHTIDIVISDNRFGLYNKNVRCIFITHQLNIKTGNWLTEKVAQKINYNYINKFDECWVPDEMGEKNLAGELSHPTKIPTTPIKYIGTLSRFTHRETTKTIDLVVLLSGPEPQRSIFENILLEQMKYLKINMVLVRGLPSLAAELATENTQIKIINHLPAAALNKLISSAKLVLARSGYSTVMDLAILQQRAILVPTPGQTEQEYLAQYLSEKKYCISEKQDGFNLQNSIEKAEKMLFVSFPSSKYNVLKDTINLL